MKGGDGLSLAGSDIGRGSDPSPLCCRRGRVIGRVGAGGQVVLVGAWLCCRHPGELWVL